MINLLSFTISLCWYKMFLLWINASIQRYKLLVIYFVYNKWTLSSICHIRIYTKSCRAFKWVANLLPSLLKKLSFLNFIFSKEVIITIAIYQWPHIWENIGLIGKTAKWSWRIFARLPWFIKRNTRSCHFPNKITAFNCWFNISTEFISVSVYPNQISLRIICKSHIEVHIRLRLNSASPTNKFVVAREKNMWNIWIIKYLLEQSLNSESFEFSRSRKR